MTQMASALISSLALLAVLSSPAEAAAPDTSQADEKAEASRRFQRALELVDDGQMAAALIEFQRSYELKPHFQVLYNIAQAHIALAQPVEAVAALERYLADGGAKVGKVRRKQVEAEILRQRARIATLDIAVTPVAAHLDIDGKPCGPLSPSGTLTLQVGVGNHVLSAAADGHRASETSITVAGEDHREVRIVLEALPPPEPVAAPAPLPPAVVQAPVLVAPAPPVPEPTPTRAFPARPLSYALAAAGIAGLAASGLLWWRAVDKHEQAQDACASFRVCPDEALHLQSQAKSAATWSTVTVALGATSLAAGVALYFLFPEETVTGHARVTPFLERQAAGLAAGGSF